MLDLLLETCNNVTTDGDIPKMYGEACFVIFAKPGKDPNLVGSYRPISLLNHDTKIFASVMAHCLNKIIISYVHQDQTGFMPMRQLADTVRRSLNLINYCTQKNIPMIIIALPFRNIVFITTVGIHGNGPDFLQSIQALYREPQAQLFIHNLRSEDFKLTRGCPLSPILFALSVEPLVEAIQNTKDIEGVNVGPDRHVISLFADDTTLYVTNPIKSLKYLMPLIEDFGGIAGFTINFTKTELYPVGHMGKVRTEIQNTYDFRWVTTTWRHLGGLIPLHLKDLES